MSTLQPTRLSKRLRHLPKLRRSVTRLKGKRREVLGSHRKERNFSKATHLIPMGTRALPALRQTARTPSLAPPEAVTLSSSDRCAPTWLQRQVGNARCKGGRGSSSVVCQNDRVCHKTRILCAQLTNKFKQHKRKTQRPIRAE